MKKLTILLCLCLALCVGAAQTEEQKAEQQKKEQKARTREIAKMKKDTRRLRDQVQAIRDAVTGLPKGQIQVTRAYHKADGTAKLVEGRITVSLNTAIGEGKQDMSFTDADSYKVSVWPLDTTNSNTYVTQIVSGRQFFIKSSSATDTFTVAYRVEGN